tara:strand:+ start:680 stop:1153 length:474 start_codon:yes stop_codon:yes gene_type:complete
MKVNYINIYNNLVNFSRNKKLYIKFTKKDDFSDRLLIFLIHFAFFLKVYKSKESKKTIQDLYDYIFKQLELSIREIGYGDASINKKMKDYISLLHSIIAKIDDWDKFDTNEKNIFLTNYLNKSENAYIIVEYFDNYYIYLKNNTFNSFLKGVINTNF